MKKTIPITIGILTVLVVAGMVVVSFFTQKFEKDSAEKEFVDWKVYKNEEYNFKFRYPSEIEIIEDVDLKETEGLLFSLNLKHEEQSFLFTQEKEGLISNVFDLHQKNQWETYGVGYATLTYKLVNNKWLVDGEVCLFHLDSNIDEITKQKFIFENEEVDSNTISGLLRECEEFYSGVYNYPANLYIFSNSFIAGFGHSYVFLNKDEEYGIELSYSYLYDNLGGQEQEEERINAFSDFSEIIKEIVSSFEFVEK